MAELRVATAGNIGNSFDSQVLAEHLGINQIDGIQSIYQPISNPDKLAAQVTRQHTRAVLFLQDHIRPSEPYAPLQTEPLLRFLRQLDIPLVTVGVGINGLNPTELTSKQLSLSLGRDTVRFIRAIGDISTSIGVRGASAELTLDRIGCRAPVSAVGLPSYFRNEQLYERLKPKKTGLFVPWRLRTMASSPFLTGPLSKLHFVRSDIFDWAERERKDTALSFTPFSLDELQERFSSYDFVVGSRLHGTVAALNAGTRALLLNDDERVREVAALTGIPFIPRHIGKKMSVKNLYEAAQFDVAKRKYSTARETYLAWVTKNLG